VLEGPAGTHPLLSVACDVTSPMDVERALPRSNKRSDRFRSSSALPGSPDDTLLLRMSEERWDNVIQTNLTDGFYRTVNGCSDPWFRARHGVASS